MKLSAIDEDLIFNIIQLYKRANSKPKIVRRPKRKPITPNMTIEEQWMILFGHKPRPRKRHRSKK